MGLSFLYRKAGRAGNVSFNMTPMIDCTFQLIIFFILTSHVATESLAKLQLAQPHASQAVAAEGASPRRVVVDVVSAEDSPSPSTDAKGRAEMYRIDDRPIAPGDKTALMGIFQSRKTAAGKGELFLEIRADQRVNFGHIEPILVAAAEAGISGMNITARPGWDRGGDGAGGESRP